MTAEGCWRRADSRSPTAGVRPRTLAEVFAYAEAEGIRRRIDGAETQVRRPKTNRPGRRAFVSGKRKQNTIKTTIISDGQGRLVWSGADRPGLMHDQTAMRTEGIAEQLRLHSKLTAEVDEGYRGLANELPDQVSAPPKKPKNDAPLREQYAWRERRRRQSSDRICVEHANVELRQWRPLQRCTGRREDYAEAHRVIASLVSEVVILSAER
ncbi:transposase family protein [Streptomyces natalensis]|uniref:transposase family protein n=1 Tax=Streptomyces natalensis TaxID=68242 RepID=UPI00068EC853|nr:transposase family protein [Streptomyces natalensis]